MKTLYQYPTGRDYGTPQVLTITIDRAPADPLDELTVRFADSARHIEGTVRVLATSVNTSGFGSNGGHGISAVHNQANFLTTGLTNSLFLQTSSGLAKITGEFVSLTPAAGATAASIFGVKSTRIADSINWQ